MSETNAVLDGNLAALRRVEPELAQRVGAAVAVAIDWQEARSGVMSGSIDAHGKRVALASKYDPAAEAQKLAETVDPGKHAGVIVLGMGLGHHVASLAKRMGEQSLMVVHEPDIGVMRAVLERIDHTGWLAKSNVLLTDDRMDRAELLSRIERFAGMLAQGTVLVTHPPSRRLHGEALNQFGQMVTEVMAYCRTNVATAMVNAARTYRNLSMNLPHYAAGASTDALLNAARGLPAVCVGAGPSLAKNVGLLKDAGVRKKVVVITAQTTLKPLLDHGIRPDFVTALDYHAISKRFYEGLPRLDDVTLVAEPMAHPEVLDSYPGPIRVTHHGFLDLLLGDAARAMVPIPYGATVAHLSFYLAQHLGCDPIVLIGQDLGFSNGVYYCPGTAIHEEWAPELGRFNTLEMMEWQRVVRHRGHLQKKQDVFGRDIYTDEQMLTYQKQFERDFAKAPQVVLDATEGGLAKDHTARVTLAEALERYAVREVPELARPGLVLDEGRLAEVDGVLERRTAEVKELRELSQRTLPILREMKRHQKDQRRLRKLFRRMDPLQRRVADLHEAFRLVNDLNTVGAFKRARADRAIHNAEIDEMERQRQQLVRDIENVDWLVQACDEAMSILRDAHARVRKYRGGGGVVVVAGRAEVAA